MKLSRKVIAGFSAAALLAMAGTFFSCKSDDEDPYQLIAVDGDNATIDASNDGTASTDADTKVATDATFIRGFRTPSTTGWKAAVYKLQISGESKNGVLGFIFDEERTKEASDGVEAEYSFYLLGVKATTGSPSIYLSRFKDVKQSELSGSGTSFGTEYTMIDSGTTDSTQANSGSKYYLNLGDDFSYVTNANTGITNTSTIYVAFKQPTKTEGYSFGIFKDETSATNWYNSNGESVKTGTNPTNAVTVFNAVNDTTFLSHYSVTTGDNPYTPTISDFNVEVSKTEYRKNQVGFYAMIPKGGSLKGSWTKVDRDILEDEVVEE